LVCFSDSPDGFLKETVVFDVPGEKGLPTPMKYWDYSSRGTDPLGKYFGRTGNVCFCNNTESVE